MIDSGLRTTLVLGGVSSGKSRWSESLIEGLHEGSEADFYYFTPAGSPEDDEMRAKVDAHRSRRPDWFKTVECGTEVDKALSGIAEGSVILFDSVGTLVSGLMMADPENAKSRMVKVLHELYSEASKKSLRIVFVSEEVGMTLVALSESGRMFQKIMGDVNQIIAAFADEVFLITAGLSQKLK